MREEPEPFVTLRSAEIAGVEFQDVAVAPETEAPAVEFDRFELCVVTEGLSLERRGSRSHVYEAASLAFNIPGEAHAFKAGQEGLRYIAIDLPPTLVDKVGADRLKPVFASRDPVWLSLAVQLRRECLNADDFSAVSVEALALEILQHASADEGLPCQAPRWFRKVEEAVRDDPTGAHNLSSLAAAIDVHPSTLARTVRAVHNCTLGDLLRSARIGAAQHLLAGSRMSLAEVALEAGFCDQSHLNRSFRRVTGVTPQMFRNAVR